MNEEEKSIEQVEPQAVEVKLAETENEQSDIPTEPAESNGSADTEKDSEEKTARVNLRLELKKMLEYVAKYPEIGPTVSKIALKVGEEATARRISAMGTESGVLRAEYYAVASHSARNERDYDGALKLVREGIDSLEIPLPKDDYNRFVKMVKTGFAVLLFNKDNLESAPTFTDGLAKALDRFSESFGEDADFLALYAQAVWLTNVEEAEKVWDRATAAPKNESSWNARGTWYKEVAKDIARAAEAYRKGLENNKDSALLGHNLAQVLIDLAKDDEEKAGSFLGEADRLLRDALRNSKRRGYRRHIHETLDRLKKNRPKRKKKEKPSTPPPSVGDKVTAKVVSIAKFGAFLEIDGSHRGLLHCSNIAHEHVHDPADFVKVGDSIEVQVIEVEEQKNGTFRIGFSRKVLLEGGTPDAKRPSNNRRSENNNNNRNDKKPSKPRNNKGRGKRDNKSHKEDSGATLGELLMAKLNEKK